MNSTSSSFSCNDGDEELNECDDEASVHVNRNITAISNSSILNLAAKLKSMAVESLPEDARIYRNPNGFRPSGDGTQHDTLEGHVSNKKGGLPAIPTRTTNTAPKHTSNNGNALYSHADVDKLPSHCKDSLNSRSVREPEKRCPEKDCSPPVNAAISSMPNITTPVKSSESLGKEEEQDFAHFMNSNDAPAFDENPITCEMFLDLSLLRAAVNIPEKDENWKDDEDSFFDDGSMFGPDSIGVTLARRQRQLELHGNRETYQDDTLNGA